LFVVNTTLLQVAPFIHFGEGIDYSNIIFSLISCPI
jgi:hypothetical protein